MNKNSDVFHKHLQIKIDLIIKNESYKYRVKLLFMHKQGLCEKLSQQINNSLLMLTNSTKMNFHYSPGFQLYFLRLSINKLCLKCNNFEKKHVKIITINTKNF